MTIRDYLKARYRRIIWWFAPVCALVLVLAIVVPTMSWVDWICVIVGGAMLSWYWHYFTGFPCPQCREPLGRVVLRVISKRHREAAHCPHCNVSLDAPMPDAH